MRITIFTIIDVAACLALVSMTFWAFTGTALWAPLQGESDGEMMRSLVLTVLHAFPVLLALWGHTS